MPSNLPTWPASEEVAPAVPAARAEVGARGPSLHGAAPRTAWHGAGFACVDPSDEPDEGSNGWVPAPPPGLAAPAIPPGPVADRLGMPSLTAPPAPLPPGALGRLRC